MQDLRTTSTRLRTVIDRTASVFMGQDEVLESVVVALLAGGHVLLEGVPGTGKTLLVKALGRVLGCSTRRVQFTPDLMPSDVTGSSLYDERAARFEFQPGPIFTELLLADEVNRAPAKTQAAMLEAMAEGAVTVEGVTHPLPRPFFVLATQNPIESAGTYPLPEAQLDRFLFKLQVAPPARAHEERLLKAVRDGFDAARVDTLGLEPVTDGRGLAEMQAAMQQVRVDDEIVAYIARLAASSRAHPTVQVGASPRASIAMLKVARVQAVLEARDYVVPDDVKMHCASVLRHRLLLHPDAEIEGVTPDEVVDSILRQTEAPSPATAAAAP